MSRAAGPGGSPLAPWLLPAAGALLLTGSTAVWAGGRLAALLTGQPVPPVEFGLFLAVETVRHGAGAVWPGVPPAAVWVLAAVVAMLLLAPLAVAAVWWLARHGPPGGPHRSLARRGDVTHLTSRAAARTAARLRPTLTGQRRLGAGEVGLALGRLCTSPRGRGPVL